MIGPLVTGGGVGLGLALIAYGLRPPRRGLAEVLETLRHPAPPVVTGRSRAYRLVADPARRLGLPRARVRQDLAAIGKDPTQHLAEQTAATVFGALVIPANALLLGADGQVPVWLALVGGVLGFRWADAQLHTVAERHRAATRQTVTTMLTLLTISLARGAGIEQALDEAAGICSGPAAIRLRQVLATARVLRQPPWQALGAYGEDTGVSELVELAASMHLAGTEGARVRAALAARAQAMRTATTVEMETAAEQSASRMAVPLLVLGIAYLIFLLYPPLVSMTTVL
ncbi:MAG: type II secretion protein F [Dactylosporangium sp.]|nr:type II secretion system F family protein [Dactylosporangium sp.]NNJ62341.1 type II secretion protein F [Dactylosporangium sp.]